MSINSTSAEIYFNSKIAGPITNVSSIDSDKSVEAVTPGGAQQDREFSVVNYGDNRMVAFISNRSLDQIEHDEKPQLKAPDAIRDTAPQLFLKFDDNITQVSQGKGLAFSPKLNAAGTKLAYLSITKDKRSALHLFDVKSATQKIITQDEKIFDLNWSSDGTRIAYSHINKKKSKISVFEVEGNSGTTLLEQSIEKDKSTAAYLVAATWSYNDKKIAFISHPLNREINKTLNIIDLGSNKVTLISNKDHQAQSPISWSKDGKRLLYAALVDYKFYYDEVLKDRVYEGAMHVYISTLNGETKQLTQGDHFHGRPIFSPDDKKIAYLYAKKLGDQRSFSLKVIDLKSGESDEFYKRVSRDSSLVWITD